MSASSKQADSHDSERRGGDRAPGQPGEGDAAPGDARRSPGQRIAFYAIGLALAAALTGISFWVGATDAFWRPGVNIGLIVLAMAQMGIHLVFFLHLSTGRDNVNNVLALAFGLLIVVLVGSGTLWIMANLAENMGPMEHVTDLHKQR